jgi:hypothetical protein
MAKLTQSPDDGKSYHREGEVREMNWAKIVLIIAAGALVIAIAVASLPLPGAAEPVEAIPERWAQAGHADTTSRSFTYWNDDDPPVIPVGCAQCHSLYGYLDYLGLNDRTPGQVDEPAHIGSVVYCYACHNEVAQSRTSVVFPGGAEVTGLGWESACMSCHYGTESTVSVNAAIEGLELDEVSEDLAFLNVHYGIAAATQMGSEAAVGYQYEGKDYVGRYMHVPGFVTCIDCHDAHSTAVSPADCAPCHANVVTYDDLYAIREVSIDYDGDGNVQVGILEEIRTFHDTLFEAIQTYAEEIVEVPLVYADRFPYWFFVDEDADREPDPAELTFANRYQSWTPRLLRAAYNYHFVTEDPGAFSHNPQYVLQLLYDAMEDLAEQVPVNMEAFTRP